MVEIDENSLEWMKKFKKYLRFDVGQLVYLKTDLKKKCPMVVVRILNFNLIEDDYQCQWITTQKELKTETFIDKTLTDGN